MGGAPLRSPAAAAVCALAAVLAAPGARAGGQPTVLGPPSVVSGQVVVLHGRGFRAGSDLSLVAAPADKGPCCAIRIVSTYLVSPAGSATLRFRMPLRYNSCVASSPPRCHKVRWARRERAVFTVTGYLQEAETATVVLR